MAVLLVRHMKDVAGELGFHNGRLETWPAAAGFAELEETGEYLRQLTETGNINIRRTYCSDQLRAVVTAIGLRSYIGYAHHAIHDSRLREREMGAFTGMTDEEATDHANKQLPPLTSVRTPSGSHIHVGVKGEESLGKTYHRGQEVIAHIIQQQEGEDALVISHGMIGRMIIGAYSRPQLPWEQAAGIRFKNCEVVRLDEEGAVSLFVPQTSTESSFSSDEPESRIRNRARWLVSPERNELGDLFPGEARRYLSFTPNAVWLDSADEGA